MSNKWKCTLCTQGPRYTKDELIDHIEKEHEDNIPEGWSAGRLAFKMIHGKDHGTCVVCKGPTEWNEKRCKYQRLCNNPECRKKLREAALKNHIRVYGKPTLLTDMHHQDKMLKGRHISGSYTFSDGTKIGYVGSFEKNFLEFMDEVLHCDGKDIQEPGPILDYEYQGSIHQWITDFLYIPYNLIIEIKDGGSNPNKKAMPDSRERQIYKEKMITNLGTYNYLRLTNNNFEQLLDIFSELKMQMVDDTNENTKVVIRINEEALTESTLDILKIDQIKAIMAKSPKLSQYLNKPDIDKVLHGIIKRATDLGFDILPWIDSYLEIHYISSLRGLCGLIFRSIEFPITLVAAGIDYMIKAAKNQHPKQNILPLKTDHLPKDYKMVMINTHVLAAVGPGNMIGSAQSSLIYLSRYGVDAVREYFFDMWKAFYKSSLMSILTDQLFALDFWVVNKNFKDGREIWSPDNKAENLSLDTEVVACNDGLVVHTSDMKIRDTRLGKAIGGSLGPAGNHIIIMHSPGHCSLYAHLQHNTLKVKIGDYVKQGQVIAKVGTTGNSTGPHLHFQMTYLIPYENSIGFGLSVGKPNADFKFKAQTGSMSDMFSEKLMNLVKSDESYKQYNHETLPNLACVRSD